jgi:hypothetical protein
MELSFPSNKQIELTFKVGVAGTSSAPQSVSVVLEKNSKSQSFSAKQDGDDWIALIDNPGHLFGEGEVSIAINVLLNNRLFTPFKGVASITGEVGDEIEIHPEVKPAEVPTPEPAEVPTPEPVVPPMPGVSPPAPEPAVTVEAPAQPKVVNSLLKSVEKAVPPARKKVTVADVKSIFKSTTVKKPVSKSTSQDKEVVANATPPVKMGLLKSIEPGNSEKKVKKVAETVNNVSTGPIFKIKRSKIILK